jgi:hypothetical protein
LKGTEERHVQKKLRDIQIFQGDYEKVEGIKLLDIALARPLFKNR